MGVRAWVLAMIVRANRKTVLEPWGKMTIKHTPHYSKVLYIVPMTVHTYHAKEIRSYRNGTFYFSLKKKITHTLLNGVCHELSAIQVTAAARLTLRS